MPELRASREHLPPFARSLPDAPEVDTLLAAFAEGNYARVREVSKRLLDGPPVDPDVRNAIIEIRRRTDPDPLSFYLFGLTAALLTFLTAWFYLHKH